MVLTAVRRPGKGSFGWSLSSTRWLRPRTLF